MGTIHSRFFRSFIICFVVIFFFFKQKTAYEIKECDWSSDVCSSDLLLDKTSIGDSIGHHLIIMVDIISIGYLAA